MKLEFEVTKGDIIYFNKLYSKTTILKSQSKPIHFILAGVIAFIIVVAMNIYETFPIINYFIAGLIVCLIIGIVTKIKYNKMLDKNINENSAGFGFHKIEVRDDELSVETKDSVSIQKWEGVQKLEETKTHFFIYIATNAAYIFPKRIFSSEDEFNRFKEDIEKKSHKKTEIISLKIQKTLSDFPLSRKNIIYFIVIIIVIIFLKVINHSDCPYDLYPAPKFAPFGEKHEFLKQGDRLALFGGYDVQPKWLGNNQYVIGTVMKFIPSQDDTNKAIVLMLDHELTVNNYTGQYVIIETRWEGQNWEIYGPVHIELCNFIPDSVLFNSRSAGKWVEAAASYEYENLFLKYFAEYDSLLKVYEVQKTK